MSKTKTLSSEQLSLLLYLEDRLVNCGGVVGYDHVNSDDANQAESWSESGFIGYGRIAIESVTDAGSHWVTFSDEAWAATHAERRARADRLMAKKTFVTTEEKRAIA